MWSYKVDKYLVGKEIEVDAVCDGEDILIPGIMEHIEKTGVHSGDSMSIYPPYSLNQKVIDTIVDYTTRIGIKLKMIGLFNIQFIVDNDNNVYILISEYFPSLEIMESGTWDKYNRKFDKGFYAFLDELEIYFNANGKHLG